MFDKIVVGGGAAGLMAAATASAAGQRVLLLEKGNRMGNKLRITGKGRCNLTNHCETEEFLACVVRNPRFMRSSYAGFSSRDVMDYFEGLGVELITERGRRVFAASGRADDIADALTTELRRHNVAQKQARVAGLNLAGGRVTGVTLDGGVVVQGRSVVLATGGLSYPKTGSDGDGYALAASAGHTILPTAPSLVPLCASEGDCAQMQGLSLKNVTLSLTQGQNGKALWKEGPGELLFTHFGVSGPLVLSASAFWQAGQHLSIDLKPALSEEQMDLRLQRDFGENAAKQFKNALGDLLPSKLIPVMVRRSGIDPEKKTGEVNRSERKALAALFKRFTITISGPRSIAEAVVTRGGVSTKEVNPKTMESKLCKGLYIIGELLDVDALTGGYNLQIAWSTGRAAGSDCQLTSPFSKIP